MVCTGGEVELVSAAGDRLKLSRGDSVYAGPDDGEIRVVGTGEVAQAYTPTSDTVAGELIDLVPPFTERQLRRRRRGRGPSAH